MTATSVSISSIGIVLPFTLNGTAQSYVAPQPGYWIPLLDILFLNLSNGANQTAKSRTTRLA